MPRVTLKSRLPEVAAELRPKVSRAIKDGAEQVAEDARRRAPVQTGALRDSIEVKRKGPASYEVGSPLYYSRFVELGTVHSAPYPFLVPASEANKDEVAERVQLVLKLGVSTTGKTISP